MPRKVSQREAWMRDAKDHLEQAACLAQTVMEDLREKRGKEVLADEWELIAYDMHTILSRLIQMGL